MAEEMKYSMDEIIEFLQLLESEGEQEFNSILANTQTLEQKLREIEYSLKDADSTRDENLSYFSPVGIFEAEEKNQELQKAKDEVTQTLQELSKKLESYKERKTKFAFLRKLVIAASLKAEEEAKEKKETEANAESKANAETEANAESKANAETKANAESEANAETDSKDKELNGRLFILENQEYDRYRISRDLHDSPVQTLTSLVHKTEFCLRLMDVDSIRVKLELQTMSNTIKSVINEMRDIIFNLRPISSESTSLTTAVEHLVLMLTNSTALKIQFSKEGDEPDNVSIWNLTVYRMIQEACSNIIKHAQAKNVKIALQYLPDSAKLLIEDDGKGFQPNAIASEGKKERQSFGLSILKERVYLLKGKVDILSEPGKGTKIEIELPLELRKEK